MKIEQDIADVVMGRPYGFSVGNSHFYLYPESLGKMYLLQRLTEQLEINEDNLETNASLEVLRLVKEKREICLTIIVYHTCRSKNQVFTQTLIEKRKRLFDKELSEEELASLMMIVLPKDKTALYAKHLGIDKEHDALQTAVRIKSKDDKGNLNFGGVSVFGALIDAACERYGWTKEYVVWGIDYVSLRLMLADKPTSMYLTKEEMNKLPANLANRNEDVVKADKENMEKIKSMDWK